MSVFRRKKAVPPPATIPDAPDTKAPGPTSVLLMEDRRVPADVLQAVEAALAPFPLEKASAGAFFGVPIGWFTREELVRIVSWVATNARDHRRDS